MNASIIITLIFSWAIYLIPTIIAAIRSHHNLGSIFVINLFLGWSFIGWIVALAMSVSSVKREV